MHLTLGFRIKLILKNYEPSNNIYWDHCNFLYIYTNSKAMSLEVTQLES